MLILLFCVAVISPSLLAQSSKKESRPKETNSIASFKLPDRLSLCGEGLPLEVPEIRERAEREFYLLLQQPGQILLYLKRSGKYFPMYETKIKELGLPEDLKYLSVAESALYQSRSEKGAVGLWQFMEGTARSMGLRVDKLVDERRHPEKSTEAALKYLKRAFSEHRNWCVTLAGYNMGQTGISNAKSFQNSDNYFDLYLNEETSRFIFRIAIIKEIMSNPAKYGFEIAKDEYYSMPPTKVISVDSEIKNLSAWAKLQGSGYKDLRLLNPWILDSSLPAPSKGESWEILISK